MSSLKRSTLGARADCSSSLKAADSDADVCCKAPWERSEIMPVEASVGFAPSHCDDVAFQFPSDRDEYFKKNVTCIPLWRTLYPASKKPRLSDTDAAMFQDQFQLREIAEQLIVVTDEENSCVEPLYSKELVNSCAGTPRTRNAGSFPPSPITPYTKRTDSLFKAFRKNSIEDVHSVLRNNADAIHDFFWDNHFEPPLCAAVRLKCNADIIQFLIEQGADASMKDKNGRTAFDVLSQTSSTPLPVPTQEHTYTQCLQSFPPWQCEDVAGDFMHELHLLSESVRVATAEQREAWYSKVARLLNA